MSGEPLCPPFVVIKGRNYFAQGDFKRYCDQIVAKALGSRPPDPDDPKYKDPTLIPATRAGAKLGIGRRTLGRRELEGRRMRGEAPAFSSIKARRETIETPAAASGEAAA